MVRILASMLMSQFERMPRVGYWGSPQEPGLPHPADFVDASWDSAERQKVIEYLEGSYQIPMFSCGPSWCRMGCAGHPRDIGTEDLTDGVWIYPEGLVHYVRHHGVRPPQAFLDHLRGRDFRHADLPTAEPGAGRSPVMVFDFDSMQQAEPPVDDHEYHVFLQYPYDRKHFLGDSKIDEALGVQNDWTRSPHRWIGGSFGGLSPLDSPTPQARLEEHVILSDDPQDALDLLKPLLQSIGLLDVCRVAYRRRTGASGCQMLWPEGDTDPFEPLFEDE
jgi:hypothetical protein